MNDHSPWTACFPNVYRAVGEVPLFGPFRAPGGMFMILADGARILVDPFALPDLSGLETLGIPTHIVICGSNHVRDAAFYRKLYGAKVCAHRDLMSHISVSVDLFFESGDVLPGNMQAVGMPGTFRGETVLMHHAHGKTAMIAGDAFFNLQQKDFKVPGMRLVGFRAELNTMPRFFIQKGGRESYRRILDCDFDALLVSHGEPILENAKDCVRNLVDSL